MTKKDLFRLLLGNAALLLPGGPAIKAGVEKLLDRNDDPTDNVDEVADAIGEIAIGTVIAVEGLSGKDYYHDPIFQQLVTNIKGDIKLLQQVVVWKAPEA